MTVGIDSDNALFASGTKRVVDCEGCRDVGNQGVKRGISWGTGLQGYRGKASYVMDAGGVVRR
eukprot:765503-Hanusia_phi.AAC.5